MVSEEYLRETQRTFACPLPFTMIILFLLLIFLKMVILHFMFLINNDFIKLYFVPSPLHKSFQNIPPHGLKNNFKKLNFFDYFRFRVDRRMN